MRFDANRAKEPLAVLIIKNSGQTPAYDMTIVANAKTFVGEEVRSFAEPRTTEHTSRTAIAAGGLAQHEIPLRGLITATGAQAIKDGAMELYVFGTIRYRDAFKRQQTTKFRFMAGGRHSWPDDDRLVVCQEGNKAT